MIVLFGPILCVAVPMVAVMIAMIIYVVAHYCLSVPLSRHSQKGEGAAGMMMKMASSEEAAEEMDNRDGKCHFCCFYLNYLDIFVEPYRSKIRGTAFRVNYKMVNCFNCVGFFGVLTNCNDCFINF